jgi:hypothetical protein
MYPATGAPSDTLVLRSPEFGDMDRYATDRLNLKTRGGTLIIFADPDWPKMETLVLQFAKLKRSEAYGLQAFIKNHMGLEIRLIDCESREWRGVITKIDDPVTQDTRSTFSASFEFEGERVEA